MNEMIIKPKNEVAPPSVEIAKEKTIPISPEEKNEKQLEKSATNIEVQSQKLENNQVKLEQIIESLLPEEGEFVAGELENTEEGKNIMRQLIDKASRLSNSQKYLEEKLSQKYNPKVVKVIGGVGKVFGGLSGMLIGHGILSAGTAVVGAKVGSYTVLKVFEKYAIHLPQSFNEKIKKKEEKEIINEKVEKIEKGREDIREKLKERGKLKLEIGNLSEEINSLSDQEKNKLATSLEKDEKTFSLTQSLKSTYEKYSKFYEEFETKYPLLTTGVEFAVHASIGPILEGIEVGERALHMVELAAAAGGAEKLTSHLLSVGNSIKFAINKAKEKLLKFSNKARIEQAPIEQIGSLPA